MINILIKKKSDGMYVGKVLENMTVEQEIYLNVIPNFGGIEGDYEIEIKEQLPLSLEYTVIDDKPTQTEIEFAEYVLATEDRLTDMENRINGGV